MSRRLFGIVLVAGCTHARMPPPAGPDQTLHDAMVLVCQAADRAADDTGASRSDLIAKHLTDGIGNAQVLQTVEAWKTDGIKRTELERLVEEAGLASCGLRDAL
jgi:hypothetical protein